MGRAALFLVSGFLIIFGLVQNSVQNRQQSLAERSPTYYNEEQSRNIAASMAEIALKELNDNPYNPSAAKTNGSEILGGTAIVDFYQAPQNINSTVFLEIKGVSGSGDNQVTTTVRTIAKRYPFSIYSYFTATEPSYIAFGSNDTLNGPVHTNGTFHMRGDPVFNGPITSPNMWEDVSSDGDSDPTFKGGQDFDSDEVPLPDAEDMAQLSQQADDGGLRYEDDKVKVEFKSDGTADITRYQQTGTENGECIDYDYYYDYDENRFKTYCDQYEQIPVYEPINSTPLNENLTHSSNFNGIISSSGLVEVMGTLKGNITLHSESQIEIIGDTVYEDYDPNNPQAELSSDNLLGMVSEGGILVDENAHTQGHNTSQNLNLNGSIMAIGDSFEVEGYNSGSHKGQLRIMGGLIQKERGPVGTAGGTGFDKLYSYDKRFLDNTTEGFPKRKTFQLESWREITTND